MVKVGIVGAGGMGNVHGRKYALMADVEVRFYEIDPEKRTAYATSHGFTPTDSFEELVAWADAMDVCLPTDLHLQVAGRCLEAGKATLVEKPLARTVAQCRELIEVEKRTGTMAMAAQVVRYFPEYARANALVKSGAIGNPGAVRARRGGKGPAGTWFHDLERSGGMMLDLMVHEFDFLHWTLGPVKRLIARNARWGGSLAEGPGDYALVTLEFDSGCVGHVESTWLDPSGFRVGFEFCGSEGMIQYDSRKIDALKFYAPNGTFAESPVVPTDDPYYKQLSAFVQAVREDSPPPVSLYEGMVAVAIAEAAIESASTGEYVAVSA